MTVLSGKPHRRREPFQWFFSVSVIACLGMMLLAIFAFQPFLS